MTVQNSYNKAARGERQIILDIETTGLEGSRLVSIGLLEMVNGKLTGESRYKIVNPEVTMTDFIVSIHHISNEVAQQQPVFAAYAKELRGFIGDSQVIITCRTKDDFTLDIGILNMEMEKAGQPQIPAEQWLNVRRWSEEMFGDKGARLDNILDHYGISRAQRDAEGHGALLDAKLLAEAYPKLLADYEVFSKKAAANNNAAPVLNKAPGGNIQLNS